MEKKRVLKQKPKPSQRVERVNTVVAHGKSTDVPITYFVGTSNEFIVEDSWGAPKPQTVKGDLSLKETKKVRIISNTIHDYCNMKGLLADAIYFNDGSCSLMVYLSLSRISAKSFVNVPIESFEVLDEYENEDMFERDSLSVLQDKVREFAQAIREQIDSFQSSSVLPPLSARLFFSLKPTISFHSPGPPIQASWIEKDFIDRESWTPPCSYYQGSHIEGIREGTSSFKISVPLWMSGENSLSEEEAIRWIRLVSKCSGIGVSITGSVRKSSTFDADSVARDNLTEMFKQNLKYAAKTIIKAYPHSLASTIIQLDVEADECMELNYWLFDHICMLSTPPQIPGLALQFRELFPSLSDESCLMLAELSTLPYGNRVAPIPDPFNPESFRKMLKGMRLFGDRARYFSKCIEQDDLMEYFNAIVRGDLKEAVEKLPIKIKKYEKKHYDLRPRHRGRREKGRLRVDDNQFLGPEPNGIINIAELEKKAHKYFVDQKQESGLYGKVIDTTTDLGF